MKKIAFLLMLLMSLGAKAGEPTTDYVYTTGLQWDEDEELFCFDVFLKGTKTYTAFGMDIYVPVGWKVVDDEGAPYFWYGEILPYTVSKKGVITYSHTITTSFPEGLEKRQHIRIACFSGKNDVFDDEEGSIVRIYVEKENVSWPLGAVKFENVELNLVGQRYDCTNREDVVVVNSGVVSLPFKISSTNKWSTCVLPFSAAIPVGVSAYTCSEKKDGESDEDKVVVLTPAESMVAYTPYILYSENGFDDTVTGTVDAVNLPETGVCTNGLLNGAIVPQTITQGYVLQNLSEGVKFYNCGGQTFSIPAGKCWLSPDAGSAKSFAFEIADPTGIKEVNKVITDDFVYTLDGKKVVTPQPKSIYIKSGKKFISK